MTESLTKKPLMEVAPPPKKKKTRAIQTILVKVKMFSFVLSISYLVTVAYLLMSYSQSQYSPCAVGTQNSLGHTNRETMF